MSTINHYKSSRRAISNYMLLTDIMEEVISKKNSSHIFGIAFELVNHINIALKLVPKPEDDELKEFVKTCCTKWDTHYTLHYEEEESLFRRAIDFEIDCLSPWVQNIVTPIRKNWDPPLDSEKIVFKVEDKKTESPLFYILAIAALNRKLCVLAEEYVKNNKDKKIVELKVTEEQKSMGLTDDHAQQLAILWYKAQRARSGSFDKPFRIAKGRENHTIGKLKTLFDEAQKSEMCPFNQEVHRKRQQDKFNSTSDRIGNNERYLLSIGAGAGKTRIEKDSTLGWVQRALGLPERCDISGTTTDAVGAAKAMRKTSTAINVNLFLFCCIYAMAIQGHHSIDEMGSAASLSVKGKHYNPLRPDSIVAVLNELDDRVRLPSVFTNTGWYSREWLSLSGENDTSRWTFDNYNWGTWKSYSKAIHAHFAQ